MSGASGTTRSARERTADERDRAADQRDIELEVRSSVADLRDREADARERAQDDREAVVAEREHAAAARAHDRDRRVDRRERAADQRDRDADERERVADEREIAEQVEASTWSSPEVQRRTVRDRGPGSGTLRRVTTAREPRRPDVTTLELVGGTEQRALVLVDHDPAWAAAYVEHDRRIRAALGPAAVQVEHIGSTSVPGLAAKPIIDVLVTVEDITAEEDYLGPLLEAGYVLRVREPGHRMVRTPARDVHVHVMTVGTPAAEDYLLFRDRLRSDPDDRDLYERTKRALLTQEWADMNAYADAKTEVVVAIKQRARESRR